jgi:hypothetical protein
VSLPNINRMCRWCEKEQEREGGTPLSSPASPPRNDRRTSPPGHGDHSLWSRGMLCQHELRLLRRMREDPGPHASVSGCVFRDLSDRARRWRMRGEVKRGNAHSCSWGRSWTDSSTAPLRTAPLSLWGWSPRVAWRRREPAPAFYTSARTRTLAVRQCRAQTTHCCPHPWTLAYVRTKDTTCTLAWAPEATATTAQGGLGHGPRKGMARVTWGRCGDGDFVDYARHNWSSFESVPGSSWCHPLRGG